MVSLLRLLPGAIVLLAASFAVVASRVHRPRASTDPALNIPDCYQCKATDVRCYVDEQKDTNLTKVDSTHWSSPVKYKGQYAYMTVSFNIPSGRIGGLFPSMEMENKFDLDATVAIHYTVKGSAQVMLYMVDGNQQCKAAFPDSSTPQSVSRISYEYPDLRSHSA
jgi:hypothetical protein